MTTRFTGCGKALAAAAALLPGLASAQAPAEVVGDRPLAVPGAGYTSSRTCRACHPAEYASWHASYHRTMTQVATAKSALGDFGDVVLGLDGRRYRLGRSGDDLWVEMAGRGGRGPVRRAIVLSTGSHHDQMYWHTTPGGGRDLKLLPFDWSIREQRWIPVRSSFLLPPGSGGELPTGTWNLVCSGCHATHPEARAWRWGSGDAGASLDTRVAEFGIACEACHGPGAEHASPNRDPGRRYELHLGEGYDPTIVNPRRLPHRAAADACGQCHSVQLREGPDSSFRPGDSLASHVAVVRWADRAAVPPAISADHRRRLDAAVRARPDFWKGYFWSDGMIRVSGREYNGLIESPCFQRGELTCISCHAMHPATDDPRPVGVWANDQLGVGMEGNAACLGCHEGLAGAEQLAAHTHHEADSRGSLCYDCHMPYTVYGIQKAHRSHQVSVPTVAESVATGRPNACSQCHLDHSLGWAAAALAAWYGQPAPALTERQRTLAAGALWALTGDAGQRALTAWGMGWTPAREASGADWMVPYLIQLLGDPYDSVRFVALRSLRARPELAGLAYDFVGPAERRERQIGRARRLWARARPDGVRGAGGAVLFDADGALRVAEFERLLAERDDSPVSLSE